MAGSGGKIKALKRDYRRLDEARARELYDAGCNDCEIARQLGVAVNSPTYWRRRNDLPPVAPADMGFRKKVVALLKSGLTSPAIADRVGCSDGYVRYVRASLGDYERLKKISERSKKQFIARHNALIGRG